MKIELRYMVSVERTGRIIAGFNDVHTMWDFLVNQREPLRVTFNDGRHTLDIQHNGADSILRAERNK